MKGLDSLVSVEDQDLFLRVYVDMDKGNFLRSIGKNSKEKALDE